MKFFSGFVAALVVAGVGGWMLLKSGVIPINADANPSHLEELLAEMAKESHIKKQTKHLKSPFSASDEILSAGLRAYQKNCMGCHGSPAETDATFANSLYPKAPQFVQHKMDLSTSEIFWVTKHGIRLSGMPAFGSMLDDSDMWKIAVFLHNLDDLPKQIHSQWLSKK